MKNILNPKHNIRRTLRVARHVKKVTKEYLSVAKNYTYSIDSPRKKSIDERELTVEGWIISKKGSKFELRIRNNGKIYSVTTGIKRLDVAKTHPKLSKDRALYSGFSSKFIFEDGDITIELNEGRGFRKLYSKDVFYSVEVLPASLYNKDLSNNYPEHLNLIENRQKFYCEDELSSKYERNDKDARLIALYLPQYHPFEENNKAWGKGFTEWSNVTTGQPRFVGHQQPILPRDLGYYDLRLDSKIVEQIDLAKKYGIYGFCFYYYWFSGKKLIDGPIESLVEHKEWDFNFSICWANENWTKRWDGRNSEVIIAQEYRDEDPLNFIKEVEHILLDKRYINENGKPVLMVYRASELKDPKRYVKVWREYFKKKHNKELQLVTFLSFDDQDPREYGFDAALDFAPHSAFFKNHLFENNQFPYIDIHQKLLDVNFSGIVADYRSIALNPKLADAYDFPVYPCVTPSWDNDARKKGKGFVYQNSSPDIYATWLDRTVASEINKKKQPLIFVNAWNEWAEGAILEPSVHLGYSVLNRTAEVLSKYSFNKNNAINMPMYNTKRDKNKRLAVVAHLYYTDLWNEIKPKLANINEPFDLFVTLNKRDADFIPKIDNKNVKVVTYVVPNRGRDVLPFLFVARRLRAAGYEYILKVHSKKSVHRKDGSSWFSEVIDSLLPDVATVDSIIATLQDGSTGLVGPANHLVSLKRHMGSNKFILEDLIKRAFNKDLAHEVISHSEKYPYFGGTMFWARLDALDPILDLNLMPDDFQSEHGQIDGTMAHALERLIGVSSWIEGRKLFRSSIGKVEYIEPGVYKDKYTYAP